MENERFITAIRFKKDKALPYAAYVTDTATGMKFSNSFDTKEQAIEWIGKAKEILTNGRTI